MKQIYQSQPVTNYEIVEIPVASAASRAAIPDQPLLKSYQGRTVVVTAIELIPVTVLSKAPVSGTANMPATEGAKQSLVLYADGWERLHNLPLFRLNPMQGNDTNNPTYQGTTYFDNLKNVDWNKSYLQFSPGNTAASAYSVLLGVQYIILNSEGVPTTP